MRWDQYTNVLQLAAALSLAGWVARTPDSQVDPYTVNSQQRNTQDFRYHPYSNLNQGAYHQNDFYNNDLDFMVQQGIQPDFPQNPGTSHESKELEENFQSFVEFHELVSWQEAYRRGDLKLGNDNNLHQVSPVINRDSDTPFTSTDRRSLQLSDDGYGSSEASIGSPSPTVLSDFSTNFDDISNSFSPISDGVFDVSDLESLQGASGFTPSPIDPTIEFDIDELLGYDNGEDMALDEKDLAKLDSERRPFASLKGIDNDLDYVNSPLKSPNFDEFLASPMPRPDPIPSVHDRSFDDPFKMQFTNSSGGNKFISDTLLELGADFNPSVFDNNLIDDEDIDQALVSSLSGKPMQTETPLIPLASIKKEFPEDHDVGDHDYQKPYIGGQWLSPKKESEFSYPDLIRFHTNSNLSMPSTTRRTFAPSPNGFSKPKKQEQKNSLVWSESPLKFSKSKKQEQKDSLVWSDFHYTTDELVSMPVETFNEVIKNLDEVRQHIAKDIRRKGKNKLAARNCRKRKIDVIDNLDHGVESLERRRISILEERQRLIGETKQIREKTEWLNNYIFEHLRDSDGSPYSPIDFSLQYTSDGNVYLVPSSQRTVEV